VNRNLNRKKLKNRRLSKFKIFTKIQIFGLSSANKKFDKILLEENLAVFHWTCHPTSTSPPKVLNLE
jgi:hypothetical protein